MIRATLHQPDVLPASRHRSGGIWDYISPSRLSCWLSCPLKFKIRYIDRIRTPTSPALFLGKQVHAGLEVFYRHRQLGVKLEPSDVVARMAAGWDQAVGEENMKFDSTDDELALKKQAVDLVAAYLAKIPTDEPPPLAVKVTMEAPLVDPVTGEDLGIPLLGITDLVTNDSGPVIVDFKTASKSSRPSEISHEIQLTSYAYLFRRLTGEQEVGLEIRSLIKTKQPKVEFHRYGRRSEARFGRLFSVIREYLDALDNGRFNYRPGWGCAMCNFRKRQCRVWSP